MFAEDLVQKMAFYQGRPIIFGSYNIAPLKADVVVTDVYFEGGIGYATFDVSFEGLTNTTEGSVILDTYAVGEMHFENVGFDTIVWRAPQAGETFNTWDLLPAMYHPEEGVLVQSEDW